MDNVAPLIPLLEAAKKCLVGTPWDGTSDAAPSQETQRTQNVRKTTEPVATVVLCELLELRRLRGLVQTAAERLQHSQQQQKQCAPQKAGSSPLSSSSPSPNTALTVTATADREKEKARRKQHLGKGSRSASQERTGAGTRMEDSSIEAQVLRCAAEHYLAVLRSCSMPVQNLCAVQTPKGHSSQLLEVVDVEGFAAAAAAPDSMAVSDVFCALVLCMAVTLCEQQRKQQQQQQVGLLPSHQPSQSGGRSMHLNVRSTRSGDVVSSSRDTSAHLQKSSTATASASSDSAYAMLRDYYRVDEELHGAAHRQPSDDGDLRATLRRVLPLLEARLPPSELWREPSLLAALDVLACGVWHAQVRVHATGPPSSSADALTTRCPLCYAAALNSDLAVAAITQLNHYYMIYHGDDGTSWRGDSMQLHRGDTSNADGREHDGALLMKQQQQQQWAGQATSATHARGWVAACRTALWNNCKAAAACLTAARSPPWLPMPLQRRRHGTEASTAAARTTPFSWVRDAACVVSLLWQHWWRAEMCLVALPLTKHATRKGGETSNFPLDPRLRRSTAQRLRCLQSFLNTFFFSSASAAAAAAAPGFETASPYDSEGVQSRVGVNLGAAGEHSQSASDACAQRHAVLRWLLSLPHSLANVSGAERTTSNDSAGSSLADVAAGEEEGAEEDCVGGVKANQETKQVVGTVLHWLCAHDDVALLRLLLLEFTDGGAAHLVSLLPTEQGVVHSGAASEKNGSNRNIQQNRHHHDSPSSLFPSQAASALYHTPHVVQLTEPRRTSLDGAASPAAWRVDKTTNNAAPAAPLPTACASPARYPSPLLDILRLHSSDGLHALDVACQRGHLACARLLLQCGLSPNALCVRAWHTYGPRLPLPFLRLLYDPAVLDGAAAAAAVTAGVGGPPGSGTTARVGLADRLRSSNCPAAAARQLAQLSYRLWNEKVRQMRCRNMETAAAEEKNAPQQQQQQQQQEQSPAFATWYGVYVQCQAAQDRVLRPALAALAYDAHEPVARLVLLAVLTQKLTDWLTTVPSCIRSGLSSPPRSITPSTSGAALAELRLQHTVALRLYTQLTCPLGRSLLRAAVDVRASICAAVEMREEKAAAMLLAAAQATKLSTDQTTATTTIAASREPADSNEDAARFAVESESSTAAQKGKEKKAARDATDATAQQQQQQQGAPLPLSDAAKARRELQTFYAAVLAAAQRLDALLAAEQLRLTADLLEHEKRKDGGHGCGEGETTSAGAATILRGQPAATDDMEDNPDAAEEKGAARSAVDVPSYVLVVIPSALALQHARWSTKTQHRTAATSSASGGVVLVEPTLWCAANTPRQVWLQLPRHVHLDELLCSHDGGGYGVVAHDMPFSAPVQRGDLVTFRHVRHVRNSTSAASSSGAPQFVAQTIFSEHRTLPYLAVSLSTSASYAPPPASLVLPFAAVPPMCEEAPLCTPPTHSSPALSKAAPVLQQLRRAASITLHACCVPSLYLEGGGTGCRAAGQHPLDWLQAKPAASTANVSRQTGRDAAQGPALAEAGILSVLHTNRTFASRWRRLVWAGLQPCWLAQTAPLDAARAAHASSLVDGIPMMNCFSTEKDDAARESGETADDTFDVPQWFLRGVAAEKVVLTVRHAAVREDGGTQAASWPSRRDDSMDDAAGDVVVSVNV